MTIEQIETELRAAMDELTKTGWRIERYLGVLNRSKRCCALGAYALIGGADDPGEDYPKHASNVFNVSGEWIESFTDGFDDNEYSGFYPEAYSLGRRLAAEYVDGVRDGGGK
jgi:hypothetical protein